MRNINIDRYFVPFIILVLDTTLEVFYNKTCFLNYIEVFKLK